MVNQNFPLNSKICLEDFEASFGNKIILEKINVIFSRNKITSIIGSSGSGKTTLLRALNRLNDMEETYSTRGNIFIHLEDQWHNILGHSLSPVFLRRKVGMVFQHPNPLPTSIERNIKLPLKVVSGMTRDQREECMVNSLKQVYLWEEVKDRLRKSALILSGGQQQRLCLARTMALEPEVILLDEPTSSLDFKASNRIEELLIELKEKYTLIVVSHSLRQTRRISDRVCILSNGKINREFDNTQIQDDHFFYKAAEEFF